MANSIGNLNVSIFGDSALQALGQTLPAVSAYSTNISTINSPYGEGSSITVKTFQNAGTTDYAGTYINTAATSSDAVVTLNKHKVAQRSLSMTELSSPYASVMIAELGKEAGQSMAEQITKDFFSLVTLGNYTNFTVVTTGSFNRNVLNGLRGTLSARGLPQAGRSLVMNNNYYQLLGNDQSYVSAIALNPAFTDTIKTGQLPEIAGFQPYEAGNSLFPQGNFSGSYAVQGIAGHKSAIAYAVRAVPTLGDYGTAAIYSVSINEKTGIAVTNTVVADPVTTGNVIFRTECVYGFSVGNAPALQVLVG